MSDVFKTWVSLPTNQITLLSDVSTEQVLAVGFVMIAFALGFISGNQR